MIEPRESLYDSCFDLVTNIANLYPDWEGAKQFEGTPGRLARTFEYFCWSQERVKKELEGQFKTFEDGYDEMLVVKGLEVWTLCPHHLLPCSFRVFIGYLPAGRLLGLSKFARIAEILARRPVIQEQYSTELVDLLMERLQPKGVGVTVYGSHGCMTSRGVRQHSDRKSVV